MMLMLGVCTPYAMSAERPIATDSRIRTLVYSENEVFRIVVNYGYQTVLEFANGEEVQTISSGNNYAWTITPMGRRLFIKPLEDSIMTNMTIITNLRSYQFELQSKPMSNTLDEELVYVVRFFYPDEAVDQIKPEVILQNETVRHMQPHNFNYTMSGSESISPSKVFDDGLTTSFEFDHPLPNVVFEAKTDGEDFATITPQRKGTKFIFNTIAPEFRIKSGGTVVNVYNEDYNKMVR